MCFVLGLKSCWDILFQEPAIIPPLDAKLHAYSLPMESRWE